MSGESRAADTRQSSNISDEVVNAVYNDFSAESMKTYRNVIVGLGRNFRKRKTTNKAEWNDFVRVVEICLENGFNVRCYVKWCFLNRLVPYGKGRALKDVSYLTHIQQIMAYASKKDEVEALYGVYLSILKSVLRIRDIKKGCSDSTVSSVLKRIMSSGRLGMFLTTGRISRYFLALIPNVENVLHDMVHRNNDEDSRIVDDFCKCCPHYRKTSANAMRAFWPTAVGKSVIEICSGK